jgi:endonuclease/exonuclease/phosphatase (EEP) superfamily protein YafD
MSLALLFNTDSTILILEYIESFRFQILIMSFVLLCLCLFVKNKIYGLLLSLSVSINLYAFYGGETVFAPTHQTESVTSDSLQEIKILAFNIWKDNPNQSNVRSLIRTLEPDIVWLQEIKRDSYHAIYADLAKKYPFSYPEKSKVAIQGNVLLSQFPFDIQKSPVSLRSSLLHAKIIIGDKKVDFFGVHFQSPRNQTKLMLRQNQFELTADYIQRKTALSGNTILAGDMNTVYWNPIFKNFRGKTHLNHHRTVTDTVPTWPSYLPNIFQIPLDYVMTSPNLCLDSHIKGDMTGSDHYPVFYNLYFCD